MLTRGDFANWRTVVHQLETLLYSIASSLSPQRGNLVREADRSS